MGSTHFKQTEPGWQKIFLSFYREFPQILAQADRAMSAAGGPGTAFQLWKAVGDELIFEVDVVDEKDVSRAVRVWLDAMTQYESQSLSDRSLALKGGAFIATFPGPDSESSIPRNPTVEISDEPVVILNSRALAGHRAHTKFLFDYFGPSIDTGFRLFSLSSRRYFPLSIEVAWAMALAANEAAVNKIDEDLHRTTDFIHHGSHVLKGVWNGREYPVFAIDREDADAVHLAMAKMNGGTMESSQIIDVCHACDADPKWPFRLYLPGSVNPAFTASPDDAMIELLAYESSHDGAETAIAADGQQELLSVPLG